VSTGPSRHSGRRDRPVTELHAPASMTASPTPYDYLPHNQGRAIAMTAISDQHADTGLRLLLTVPEAAVALAISRSKLYELLAAGLVRSVRIDGSRRIPVEALDAYIADLLAQEGIADAEAS
jgi:excisionase family DNA binding protein